VANVMLSVGWGDEGNAEAFSRWLGEECPHRQPDLDPGGRGSLRPITGRDNQWGGHKHPECAVFAGALNHADLDAVIRRFGEIEWYSPNAVQLFVMDQEDAFFRVWMIRDGAVRQYAPTVPDEEDDEFWPAEEPRGT
jgi:hypothetical protein